MGIWEISKYMCIYTLKLLSHSFLSSFRFFQGVSFVMNHSFLFSQYPGRNISESVQGIATAHASLPICRWGNGLGNDFSLDQGIKEFFDLISRPSDSPQNFALTGRSASFADCIWISHNSDGIVFHIAIITTFNYHHSCQ